MCSDTIPPPRSPLHSAAWRCGALSRALLWLVLRHPTRPETDLTAFAAEAEEWLNIRSSGSREDGAAVSLLRELLRSPSSSSSSGNKTAIGFTRCGGVKRARDDDGVPTPDPPQHQGVATVSSPAVAADAADSPRWAVSRIALDMILRTPVVYGAMVGDSNINNNNNGNSKVAMHNRASAAAGPPAPCRRDRRVCLVLAPAELLEQLQEESRSISSGTGLKGGLGGGSQLRAIAASLRATQRKYPPTTGTAAAVAVEGGGGGLVPALGCLILPPLGARGEEGSPGLPAVDATLFDAVLTL